MGLLDIFSRNKSVVGLDIGSSSVKLVELTGGKGSWTVTGAAHQGLPAEAIVDGAIMDAGTVAEAIRSCFEQARIKSDAVATAVSGHAVIIKRISMPAMSVEELAESIQWEAEQYIPFDISEVSLDYQIMEHMTDEGNMDVLLVAVKRDKINDYTSAIAQAQKSPVVVDIDAFAVQNCYEMSYSVDPALSTALINIGASVTNIAILNGPNPTFWRDINVGGNQYTDAIQKELNLPYETAEAVKKGEGGAGADVPRSSVVPIIQSVTEEIGNELNKTLGFYKATSSEEDVDRIVLSGGGAMIEGLQPFLHERFGCPVELMDPLRGLSRKGVDDALLDSIGSSLAVAVGLGTRRPGDKAAA